MVRRLYQLGRMGSDKSITVPGFDELHVGIVGLGHVGSRLADMFKSINVGRVSYWSMSTKDSPYERLELDELLRQADIICFCVSADAGSGYIDSSKLGKIKDGAIVTTTISAILDEDDLLNELKNGRLRAYLDYTPETAGYSDLDLGTFYCSNVKTSYNTSQANRNISDMATESMINMLAGKDDEYRVTE